MRRLGLPWPRTQAIPAVHNRTLRPCVLRIAALPPQPSSSRTTKAWHLAETLSVATIGGGAFGVLGVPAGWLSGAMLAVACAALAGRPMYMPLRLTWTILVLIGISLGAVVTPATL